MKWAWSLFGGLLLLTLADRFAGRVVDDLYIYVAYARGLAEGDGLRWTTGEAVEGYSSLLWVVVGVPAIWMSVDPIVWYRAVSVVAAVLAVWLFAPRQRALPAVLPMIALAAWLPMQRWAVSGMETSAFTLFLSLGWAGLAMGGRHAPWWLLLASQLRPEGMVYLLLGLALERSRGPLSSWWFAAGWAWVVLQVVRLLYFETFWATPFLVKVLDGGGWTGGVPGTLSGLASGLGLLSVCWWGATYSRRTVLFGVAPVAIQAALMLSAGGDWMGCARLLVPGVCAAAYLGFCVERGAAKRSTGLLFVPLVVLGGAFEPDATGEGRLPLTPVGAVDLVRRPPLTPLGDELGWLVEHVPPGRSVVTGDVGVVGHIPGVAILDRVGLVDRLTAEYVAFRDPAVLSRLIARYSDPATAPFALQVHGSPDGPGLEGEFSAQYPFCTKMADRAGSVYFCAIAPTRVKDDVSRERWRVLASIFPKHPWIRWRHALAEASVGGKALGAEVMDAGPPWCDWREGCLDFVRTSGALRYSEEGFLVDVGDVVLSRRLDPGEYTITGTATWEPAVTPGCHADDRRIVCVDDGAVEVRVVGAGALRLRQVSGPD